MRYFLDEPSGRAKRIDEAVDFRYLFRFSFFYLQSKMEVVGDTLEVFDFSVVTDVGVDIPTVALVLLVLS